jgi:hypothetical protein
MTQNQKLILGVGAIALAYWFYTKNKAKKKSNDANFSNLTAPIRDCNIFHENPRIVREQDKLCQSMGLYYGGRCYGCVKPVKDRTF